MYCLVERTSMCSRISAHEAMLAGVSERPIPRREIAHASKSIAHASKSTSKGNKLQRAHPNRSWYMRHAIHASPAVLASRQQVPIIRESSANVPAFRRVGQVQGCATAHTCVITDQTASPNLPDAAKLSTGPTALQLYSCSSAGPCSGLSTTIAWIHA